MQIHYCTSPKLHCNKLESHCNSIKKMSIALQCYCNTNSIRQRSVWYQIHTIQIFTILTLHYSHWLQVKTSISDLPDIEKMTFHEWIFLRHFSMKIWGLPTTKHVLVLLAPNPTVLVWLDWNWAEWAKMNGEITSSVSILEDN